jgi:hypothetical protein
MKRCGRCRRLLELSHFSRAGDEGEAKTKHPLREFQE